MNAIKSKVTSGTTINVEGEDFTLDQLVDGVWNATNKKTRAYKRISGPELLEGYRNGTVKIGRGSVLAPTDAITIDSPVQVPLDMLTEKTQALVRSRRLYLEHLAKVHGISPDGKSIDSHLHTEWDRITKGVEKMPSMQTIRRWLKRYQLSGKNILALEALTRFRGCRKSRINEKLEELGLEALHYHYLKPERGTLLDTLGIFRDWVKKENALRNPSDWLKIPTINMLRSLLNRLEPFEIHAARYGIEAARNKFRGSVENQIAELPGDRYEIDHTRLDVTVVDEATGIYLGRPWLTLVIDKATRAIVGFWLSMEPPSGESLAKAFKHAMMPKNIKGDYPEIKNEWDMYGVPLLIVCDNGMEFYGHSFIDMCLQLGIRVEYMPRKSPWWKGSIERAIRTFNEGFCGLMPGGRTFGSIEEKGDYDPVKTAIVTMEYLDVAINTWIVDIYNQKNHRSIQTTPAWKWKSLIDTDEIVLLEDPSILDKITGQIETRQWQAYGIELNGIHYNSAELKHLWNQSIGSKKSLKVTVRWSSEELGSITVMLPNSGHITVPPKRMFEYVKGMSLRQFKLTKQDLINRGLDPDNQENVMDAKVRLINAGQEYAKAQKGRNTKYKRELAAAADFEKPSTVVETPVPISVPAFMTAVATPVFKSSIVPSTI